MPAALDGPASAALERRLGRLGRIGPGSDAAALTVTLLWIGLTIVMLLQARALLPLGSPELVSHWRWEARYLEPGPLGLGALRAWAVVNPLFAVLLWANCRFAAPPNLDPRPVRLAVHLGTALLLLLSQWAIVRLGQLLPPLHAIRIHP